MFSHAVLFQFSYNAMMLLQCLNKIADSGCCVLLSIHHPNISMFESLDHVFVVHQGRSFFQCDSAGIHQYFEARGIPVLNAENPSDWILTVMQTHNIQDLEDRGFFSAHKTVTGEKLDGSQDKKREDDPSLTELDATDSDADYQRVDLDVSNHSADSLSFASSASFARLVKDNPTSIWMETKNLLVREAHRAKRDKAAAAFRLGVSFFGAIVFAIVFHGVADGTIESPLDFR